MPAISFKFLHQITDFLESLDLSREPNKRRATSMFVHDLRWMQRETHSRGDFRNFKRVFSEDDDASQHNYRRIISGPRTAAREERVKAFCERHTWRQNCGCSHDCCGCNFQRRASYVYKAAAFIIDIHDFFNY